MYLFEDWASFTASTLEGLLRMYAAMRQRAYATLAFIGVGWVGCDYDPVVELPRFP